MQGGGAGCLTGFLNFRSQPPKNLLETMENHFTVCDVNEVKSRQNITQGSSPVCVKDRCPAKRCAPILMDEKTNRHAHSEWVQASLRAALTLDLFLSKCAITACKLT